jgi:hypothetical protein
MRDAHKRRLSIVNRRPHVEVAPDVWKPYQPTIADLGHETRGPWIIAHALCQVCPRQIPLPRIRAAIARGQWPGYCSATHSERAKKHRHRAKGIDGDT